MTKPKYKENDSEIYCQIAGQYILADVCLAMQNQQQCSGCAAQTRLCELCKSKKVAYPQIGLCKDCLNTALAKEPVAIGSVVSVNTCKSCLIRNIAYPQYGLCLNCLVKKLRSEQSKKPIKEPSMGGLSNTIPKKKGTKSKKGGKAKCTKCKKNAAIYSSGLCASCYARDYSAKRSKLDKLGKCLITAKPIRYRACLRHQDPAICINCPSPYKKISSEKLTVLAGNISHQDIERIKAVKKASLHELFSVLEELCVYLIQSNPVAALKEMIEMDNTIQVQKKVNEMIAKRDAKKGQKKLKSK
jgi:hypothetical protein